MINKDFIYVRNNSSVAKTSTKRHTFKSSASGALFLHRISSYKNIRNSTTCAIMCQQLLSTTYKEFNYFNPKNFNLDRNKFRLTKVNTCTMYMYIHVCMYISLLIRTNRDLSTGKCSIFMQPYMYISRRKAA